MEISGWGRYPKIDTQLLLPKTGNDCVTVLKESNLLIPRGLGRSYGDSSLAPQVLETTELQYFQEFNPETGVLSCDAGVSLYEILNVFVPKGWFLPVTPGTRFVTVGGAIASDVHGKNHHIDGTFCEHVLSFDIALGNGEIVIASPMQNPDLFHATCGGMGLTGVIIAARIQLKSISSSDILETTIKAPNLDAVLDGFEKYADSTYSVAWIDCLAKGADLGRSLLMIGEHATDGGLKVASKKPLTIPMDAPAQLLNPLSIKAFNTLYYGKVLQAEQSRRTTFETYFYPLDQMLHWNRLYGKPGFLQYQFVIPKNEGRVGMRRILEEIVGSGQGSFLAVIKIFGKQNKNFLSFPIEGYTLALDFRFTPTILQLLDRLDQLVLEYGGRIYLTKDARMSEKTFKNGYPRWQEFESVRRKYHAIGKFSSLQSRRLGLE